VLLDRTPFYAQSGGQVGDTGVLAGPGGLECRVLDAFMDHEFRLHAAEVARGSVKVGDTVTARVDGRRRLDTARNHTATHLLQWALRKVLGDHCRQAGSEVSPDRLRFDFTHPSALSADELRRVADLVNEKVFDALPVSWRETTLEEARRAGAMALFGEKYGDVVRMLSIGDISHELCGGTHLADTNQIGLFKIMGEESVAAGVRRITALTGRAVAAYAAETEALLEEATALLKANRQTLLQRIEAVQKEIKSLKHDLQKARSQASRTSAADVFANVQDAGGVPLVAAEIEGADMSALRELVDVGRAKLPSAVFVLGSRAGDKVSLVVGVTKDLVARGLHAGKIVKEVAAVVGGSGGGRPDLAQAGGNDAARLSEALAQARAIVAAMAS
jgi:alanyl-tRNA synthetase